VTRSVPALNFGSGNGWRGKPIAWNGLAQPVYANRRPSRCSRIERMLSIVRSTMCATFADLIGEQNFRYDGTFVSRLEAFFLKVPGT